MPTKEETQQEYQEIIRPQGVIIFDMNNKPMALLEPPGPSKKPRIGFGARFYDDNGNFMTCPSS